MIKCCLECGEKNRDIAKFCKKCGKSLAIKRETHGTRGYALRKNVVLRERYIIEKLIKAGGMGAVYKVEDLHMKKFSAVKELRPYWIDSEQESRYLIRKFRSEANLLSQLHHMGLPRVTDYFIEEDRYYLVMDFIEGCDLQTLLTEQGNPGLPYRDVLNWGIEICEVLEYLHNYVPPVIYRDLKPSNIMIRTSDSKVILIDFGIACVIQPDLNESQRTRIGTIGFMPPEQYMGKPVLASDIYALGATLYNLFTGIKPLPFIQQTFEGTNISEITPLLEEIISRALKPNLSERYKKVSEIKQDLQKVLNHLSSSSSADVKDEDSYEDFNKPAELDLEELAFDETPPCDFFVDNEGVDINIDDDFWEDFTFEEKSLLFDAEDDLISDEIPPEKEKKFDTGDVEYTDEIPPEEEKGFNTEDVENIEELILEEIPLEEEKEFDTGDVENTEKLILEEIFIREGNEKEIVWDYYNKALDLIDKQKIHEAIELCEKALSIDNEFLEVYYTLGSIYKKVNRSDLAVESYKKYLALKQKKTAEKLKGRKPEGLPEEMKKEKRDHSKGDKVKKITKESISLSEILEISQRIIEKTELSRDIIRPVARKVKSEVHEEKRTSLQKEVQAGEIHVTEESKTPQIKTEDLKNNLSSAKMLTKQGQFTMAIGEYRKILDNNPNMTNIYINMAEVHKKAGEFKPAIKNYEKYLNINPDDLNIHFEIGLLYKIIGDRTQAIRHFGICINKDAGTSLTKRARRYIEEIRDLTKD